VAWGVLALVLGIVVGKAMHIGDGDEGPSSALDEAMWQTPATDWHSEVKMMTKIALIAALLLAATSALAQSRGGQIERLGAARMNAKLMAQHMFCPGADKDEIVSWVTDIANRIEKREGTARLAN
jgi:hypothetical protein